MTESLISMEDHPQCPYYVAYLKQQQCEVCGNPLEECSCTIEDQHQFRPFTRVNHNTPCLWCNRNYDRELLNKIEADVKLLMRGVSLLQEKE